MDNIKKEMAVQSFCFRNFKDNEVVAQKVKDLGLSRIELCGIHVDFSDEEQVEEVIDIYQQAGVDIISSGVNQLSNNPHQEKYLFEFAKKAGSDYMSVDFAPDSVPEAYKTAEQMAQDYDLKLGIHNHGGRHWLGNSQILETVFAKTGDRIGLCLDTAWALDAGEDPLEMAQKFEDRLYGVHYKDFDFDSARNPEDVVVGTGNLDLSGLVNYLKEIDFSGISVLEYEGEVENPVPSLQECLESMQKEW